MSEAVFLDPRNAPNNSLVRAAFAAFGIAGINVTTKPGRLYQARALNKGATAYFLQVFDKATPPVANDTPIWEAKLQASLDCPLDFGLAGLYVANGIGVAISTTAGTLTLAVANDAVLYTQHTTAG